MEFKIGDIVRILPNKEYTQAWSKDYAMRGGAKFIGCGSGGIGRVIKEICNLPNGVWVKIGGKSNWIHTGGIELVSPITEYKCEFKEETKMELKEIKPKNAKEALKQYNEEKSNAEIEFAKKELRMLNDNIDSCDRRIKFIEKEKKGYTDKLAELRC